MGIHVSRLKQGFIVSGQIKSIAERARFGGATIPLWEVGRR